MCSVIVYSKINLISIDVRFEIVLRVWALLYQGVTDYLV